MLYGLIQTAYEQTIRPFLPEKIGMKAGVATRNHRLFDINDRAPNHNKRDLSRLTWDAIDHGDDVAVIGGGLGISAVAAARATGPSGSVSVYEAEGDAIERLTETIQLNAVAEWTTIHHAVVGEMLVDADEIGDPKLIEPKNLPDCDVIQFDCEGAELPILNGLAQYPDTILVETHPRYDAPTDSVMDALLSNGYSITNQTPDPVSGDVLLATKNQ